MIGMGLLEQRRTAEPLQGPPPVPREDWYYVVSGERRGPTDLAGLQREAAAGLVRPETLVWKSGMAGWMKVTDVAELQGVRK
jgi:hypothetical protein